MVRSAKRVIAIAGTVAACSLGCLAPAAAAPPNQPGAPADPPSAPPDPNGQLMGLLPEGFDADNCKPAPSAPKGALAEVDCTQNDDASGPQGATLWLFDNRADMAGAFRDVTSSISLANCSGDTASPSVWNNNAAPNKIAGSLACGTDTKYNVNQLVWTDNAKQTMTIVWGGEIAGLNQWWMVAF
jgi:serine/threonine kinase PknH